MLNHVNSCFEQKFETQYPQPIPRRDENIFEGVEESEIVDELMQILVECVKKADMRGQEILLRKFFVEIEKEIPLQGFLVDRLNKSKISSLFDSVQARLESEMTMRELRVAEGETSEKLERFKVKTVQVGVVVKEENAK